MSLNSLPGSYSTFVSSNNFLKTFRFLKMTANSGGFPLITSLTKKSKSNNGGFGLGGINGTGQVRPYST